MVETKMICYHVSIEEELRRNQELRLADIETVRAWIITQPHLPSTIQDAQIVHFLQACYFDVEHVKKVIDRFYKYKNTMPNFFQDWDPLAQRIQNCVSTFLQVVLLPKPTPEDCRIIVMKLNDKDASHFDFDTSIKWLLMTICRLLIQEGSQGDFKFVYDCSGFSMSHLMRCPLASAKNYLTFGQKAASIRVVEISYMNSSPVIKKLMTMLKPFLNKDISKLFSFHTDSNGFFKNIRPEITPVDYGGTGPSMETLHKENIKKIENIRETLITSSFIRSDMSKRVGKRKPSKVEDDFRKLELD